MPVDRPTVPKADVASNKDGGGFSVASQGFARYRETPWLQHFAGIAIFGVSMEAGGNL